MADHIEDSIVLKAPVERVWRALTDAEEFGTWFMVKLIGPFVVGKITKGNITAPGYEHVAWEATITRMDAPGHFAYSWHPYAVDSAIDYTSETPTQVAFTLAPVAEGTRLTVVESGFDAIPATRQAEAYRMHQDGWAEQLKNIRKYLED